MSMSSGSLLVAEPRSLYIVEPSSPQWIEVLVNCPNRQELDDKEDKLYNLYTYSIPSDLKVTPGDIVSVPFGPQILGGVAIRYTDSLPVHIDYNQVKNIYDVIASGFFTRTYFTLLEKVSSYYCTNLISVIKAALPPGLLNKYQRRIRLKKDNIPPGADTFCTAAAAQILKLLQQQKDGDYSYLFLKNKVRGSRKAIKDLGKREWIESYFKAPDPPKAQFKKVAILNSYFAKDISKRHQEILHFIKSKGGQILVSELVQEAKTTAKTIQKLAENGYIIIEDQEVLRLEQGVNEFRDQSKQLSQH